MPTCPLFPPHPAHSRWGFVSDTRQPGHWKALESDSLGLGGWLLYFSAGGHGVRSPALPASAPPSPNSIKGLTRLGVGPATLTSLALLLRPSGMESPPPPVTIQGTMLGELPQDRDRDRVSLTPDKARYLEPKWQHKMYLLNVFRWPGWGVLPGRGS